VRSGDIERHVPALAARRPPELTDRQKDELKRKLAEIEKRRASTLHQFAQSELETPGRFAAVNQAQVVGQKPQDPWPKLPSSSPWSGMPADYVEWRDASQPPPLDMRPKRPLGRRNDDERGVTTVHPPGGRFEVDEPYVVGSTAIPKYPPAVSQADHSGNEPPLGSDNPAFDSNPEPSYSPARDTGDPADAPLRRYKTGLPDSAVSDERAGSSSSSKWRR
jgi:hypothetical protein